MYDFLGVFFCVASYLTFGCLVAAYARAKGWLDKCSDNWPTSQSYSVPPNELDCAVAVVAWPLLTAFFGTCMLGRGVEFLGDWLFGKR